MKNKYLCPKCGSDEVYRIHQNSIFYPELYIEYIPIAYGLYDIPELGDYECANGHAWSVTLERNKFEEFTQENC